MNVVHFQAPQNIILCVTNESERLHHHSTLLFYCLNIIAIYLEHGFLSMEICFWILGFMTKSAFWISNSKYRFPSDMHSSKVL